MVGKAYSLMKLNKMLETLDKAGCKQGNWSLMTTNFIKSVHVLQDDEGLHLIINHRQYEGENDLNEVVNCINTFFPYAEGVMTTIKPDEYAPEIMFFTRYGNETDRENVKFVQTHNTVQPYIEADHDSDLTDAEKATLERFINDFTTEDDELKYRVNEIIKKHI
jgi:hypothetical protein